MSSLMMRYMKFLLQGKGMYVFFFMTAGVILLYVYYLEYYENLPVCNLCYRDRIAFFCLAVISVVGYTGILKRNIVLRLLQGCCLMGVALALYHLGVELHWWSSSMCTASPFVFSTEDLQNAMQGALQEEISCSNVVWRFLGFSLVVYAILVLSVLFCLAQWNALKG